MLRIRSASFRKRCRSPADGQANGAGSRLGPRWCSCFDNTYAAFLGPKVIGYITLVCGEVVTGDDDNRLVQEEGLKYLYNHYPAIKIARLAVDHRFRGNGVGEGLVQLAFGRAKDIICPAVGCRFVMVDSKKTAISFYERCGFTMLDTTANRERDEPVMFLDLSKLPAA